MTTDGQTAAGLEYQDRKAGLVIFGIIEILFGAICAGVIFLMILALLASAVFAKTSAPPMSVKMMVPGLLFYAVLTIWFIWMGIGSIKARRWARALLLVTSWLWLISGIIGLVFMLVFLPDMYKQMSQSGQMPAALATVMKYIMLGFMTVFYVIIPGVLVLFYGSRHVKATCEQRDPVVRWTDKCPLPVLAVSLMALGWAAAMPFIGFYGWQTPFFGFILRGTAGAAVSLASMLLLVYVAWGTYRLSLKAWGLALVMLIAGGISMSITFYRVPIMDFYAGMDFPAEQLAVIKQITFPSAPLMVFICVFWGVIALAYLLYTRRYFIRVPEQPGVQPDARIQSVSSDNGLTK